MDMAPEKFWKRERVYSYLLCVFTHTENFELSSFVFLSSSCSSLFVSSSVCGVVVFFEQIEKVRVRDGNCNMV